MMALYLKQAQPGLNAAVVEGILQPDGKLVSISGPAEFRKRHHRVHITYFEELPADSGPARMLTHEEYAEVKDRLEQARAAAQASPESTSPTPTPTPTPAPASPAAPTTIKPSEPAS